MKIAVIILNYNSSADCTQCISFLKRQEDADLDIVIVDNGSHAEDVAHLRALCETEGCVFLPCTQNRGYSAGNNTGLRYAADKGYRYALITNPDMEFPQTDYISKLVGWMDTDRRIAVAGTDITGPDGLHQNPMKPEGNWRNSFDWIKTLFRKKKTDAYRFIDNHQTSHYCHKLGGCCMMVNLAFIREIGYLDEYPFLYCEEAILSKQVERSGWRMYYSATSRAIHRHINKDKGDPAGRFREWRRSRIYFIERYSDDSRLGKQIAKLSIRIYIALMILVSKIKK